MLPFFGKLPLLDLRGALQFSESFANHID